MRHFPPTAPCTAAALHVAMSSILNWPAPRASYSLPPVLLVFVVGTDVRELWPFLVALVVSLLQLLSRPQQQTPTPDWLAGCRAVSRAGAPGHTREQHAGGHALLHGAGGRELACVCSAVQW